MEAYTKLSASEKPCHCVDLKREKAVSNLVMQKFQYTVITME